VTYETNPTAVSKKVVFVADNTDIIFNFQASSDEHATFVPADYTVEKLYLGPMSAGAIRGTTIQRFNDGVFLIAYNGHGAITKWADETLLTSADQAGMTNVGRYPFVFVTNCLSANFADSWRTSMSETFTHNGEHGAIGFFASTSANTPWGQHELARELYKLLWAGMSQAGPLVTAAKVRIGATGNHLDIVRGWVLIGDPALRLAYPR